MIRNKVTITKVDFKQLEAVHYELELFAAYVVRTSLKNDFLNAIMVLDIAQCLFYFLRGKLENENTIYTISFSASQAAVILKCCIWNRTERSTYTKNVMRTLSFLLDEQLNAMV